MEPDKTKSTKIDSVKTVREYIDKADWRINANANTDYSHAGLVNNVAGKVIANFWLDGVYSPEEGEAHRNGDYHIHDLDILAPYCCGHDLQKLLDEGFNGVVGRVSSKPPKHFREALYQMANYLGILQAEWAGAQAFSSFDTYLAPYVFFDMNFENLTYKEIRRAMTSFVYNLNVPSRWGQCVPASYKCLKVDGTWVSHSDLKVGDEIFVFDVSSQSLKKDVIKAVNVFPAPAKMHKYTPVDEVATVFYATPNHKMLHFCGDKLEKVESQWLKDNDITPSIPVSPIRQNFQEGETVDERFLKTICKIEEVDAPCDTVWCPTTDTGTFVCLTDDGHCVLTGNSPFTNVTLDWKVPQLLKDMVPTRGGDNFFMSIDAEYRERDSEASKILGGTPCSMAWMNLKNKCIKRYEEVTGEKYTGEGDDIFYLMTYSMFQPEMDLINQAFYEVLNAGDLLQMPFTFPIPTINITEDFDWDAPNANILFENTAKYGSSYFQNFIGSQYKRDENGELVRDENAYSPNDVRSMCCRLQLDKTQLRKRGGGLFGSDSQTGCYDEFTEVLTSDGWKKFYELSLEDKFYTLNKEGKIEIHKPEALFAYPYDGEMLHFSGKRCNLLVTPNHRMLGISQSGKYFFLHAEHCRRINIPIAARGVVKEDVSAYIFVNDKKIHISKWLLFLGIYLSEGYVYINEEQHRYWVQIKQNKNEKATVIRNALKMLPFKFSEREKNGVCDFFIYNKELAYTLSVLGKTENKRIPSYVWECGTSDLLQLYHGLMIGDGSYTDGHRKTTFYTSSERLRDDFQRLLLHIGLHGDYLGYTRRGNMTEYQINVTKSKIKSIAPANIKTVRYKGRVYCAQVPNNTLFVRRNGKTCWCGNSIGVVTINMARLGYKHKGNMPKLLENLDSLMDMGKSTLEKKRKFVQEMFDRGLYPYTRRYIRTFDTYFSTIGVNGMNEMVRNFTNDEYDITDDRGQKMCLDILEHIRERLVKYQEETGNLYNLEATPAEGTMRRFSHLDKKKFPDILQAGSGDVPYYTNSSQLPVDFTADAFTALDLQDDLQKKYTGGCVEKGNLVFTNRGRLPIEYIVENFESLSGNESNPFCALSYNEETQMPEMDKIVDAVKIDVSKHDKIRITFADWDIVTSDWHPFYVYLGGNPHEKTCEVTTRRADELKPGDLILGGDPMEVKATSKVDVSDETFYDLTTEKNHNYLCGKGEEHEVFIHNTVLHVYMRERLSSPDACKRLVKAILSNYRLPYISITPTFSICPIHGRLEGEVEFCPHCDAELIRQHAQEVDPNL